MKEFYKLILIGVAIYLLNKVYWLLNMLFPFDLPPFDIRSWEQAMVSLGVINILSALIVLIFHKRLLSDKVYIITLFVIVLMHIVFNIYMINTNMTNAQEVRDILLKN